MYSRDEMLRTCDACDHFAGEWANPTTAAIIRQLLETEERLRVALAFYADQQNYSETFEVLPCGCCSTHDDSQIEQDLGAIAREALNGPSAPQTR